MPAEKIQTSQNWPGRPADPAAPHVRVSWGADHGYVQVASLFDGAHGATVLLDTVNGWLRAAELPEVPGREEMERLILEKAGPDSLPGQFGVNFDGFHVTLEERRDSNRLIQAIKRARDGAFGRDE